MIKKSVGGTLRVSTPPPKASTVFSIRRSNNGLKKKKNLTTPVRLGAADRRSGREHALGDRPSSSAAAPRNARA